MTGGMGQDACSVVLTPETFPQLQLSKGYLLSRDIQGTNQSQEAVGSDNNLRRRNKLLS